MYKRCHCHNSQQKEVREKSPNREEISDLRLLISVGLLINRKGSDPTSSGLSVPILPFQHSINLCLRAVCCDNVCDVIRVLQWIKIARNKSKQFVQETDRKKEPVELRQPPLHPPSSPHLRKKTDSPTLDREGEGRNVGPFRNSNLESSIAPPSSSKTRNNMEHMEHGIL